MNISFYILLLFVVSTYAGKLQPKRLGLKETKRHVDSGIGASGIQSSSSVDSANVRKTRSITDPGFKTLVIQRERENCFSKFPVRMCADNENASQTESQQVDLVCLDKNSDPLAIFLVKEAKKRMLSEFMGRDKTETYTYDSPTKCSN